MALPRTKIQLQNEFRAWFEAYAISAGWDAATKGANYLEVAREMAWALINGNLEEDIGRRITKISGLTDPASFDPYYQTRIDFLTWMTT